MFLDLLSIRNDVMSSKVSNKEKSRNTTLIDGINSNLTTLPRFKCFFCYMVKRFGTVIILCYYRHRWNTRIFPVTKIWYPVKIQFLSFTCEDITVVMATSVSANRKRASQHLAIGVYIINRILHARLWIRIFIFSCSARYLTSERNIELNTRR